MDKLGMLKAFLVLGDMTSDKETRESKLKYKERIVFATMRSEIPDWEPPSDWYSLPIEERERRLEYLQKEVL